MIRVLLSIALNRHLRGDPVYIRCARCGAAASSTEGAPLLISSMTTVRRGQPAEHVVTPPEWTCPRCGRSGPLEVGEQLANDTLARCRRTFLCRYVWKVPGGLVTVTCPRCYTRQPVTRMRLGPGGGHAGVTRPGLRHERCLHHRPGPRCRCAVRPGSRALRDGPGPPGAGPPASTGNPAADTASSRI